MSGKNRRERRARTVEGSAIGSGRRTRKETGPLTRRLAIAAVLVVLGAAVATLWLFTRVGLVQENLGATEKLLPALQSSVVEEDSRSAKEIVAKLQMHTSTARSAATDPIWKAASFLPVLGPNLSAVSEISVSADDVVNHAVRPLVGELAALNLDSLVPSDGAIDLAPLEAAAPSLTTAFNTVRLSHDRLAEINTVGLMQPVAEPVARATESLSEAEEALQSLSTAGQVLPEMLGSNGTRHYLILIQNLSEARATGGISGALAVIQASEGQIELKAQSSGSALGEFEPPIVKDSAQLSIYGSEMSRFIQSANLTPDFPTAASTAATMWETRKEGDRIDGVIALDPVVLANILRSTGPIEVHVDDPAIRASLAESGLSLSLNHENVVQTLQADVYSAIPDPKVQDAYFAEVAAQIFDSLSAGTLDGRGLVEALLRSSDEGRLLVWSTHASEQALIESTQLVGSVTGEGSGGATFGAYFNDGTGAKMDYYMRRTVQLHRSCAASGLMQYTLRTTITNNAPLDAAEALPEYVTGGGAFGVPPGSVQSNLVVYGPDRSQLQTARVDGELVPLGSHIHGDRPVGVLTTRLGPGETAEIQVDFTNVLQKNEPRLDVTPLIQPSDEVILPLEDGRGCEPQR